MSKVLGALVALSLVFTVGCSSNSKKQSEDTMEPAAATDASIESKDISFDPEGSDSSNIEGLASIQFGYDRASLTAEARSILASNVEWLRSNSNLNMQIEGHCDSRGSVEYNLALGEKRAKSVKDYLVSLGVDQKRLSIISYGKEKPLRVGDSESVHAANRRANFVPLPQ